MTQLKTGACSSSRRLPQKFGKASVAIATFACGAIALSSGFAQAAPGDFPPIPVGTITDAGATLTGITGPTPGAGTVEFDFIGLQPSLPSSELRKTWQVDTDFEPSLNSPYSGVFEYKLDAPAGEAWINAALSQNIVPPFAGADVTKLVCTDSTFLNNCTTIGPVFNSGFTPVFTPILTSSTIYVRDTYIGVPPAVLDNYINAFQTPGPLPILGAGATFGFSRKLRGRIKAARLS